MPTLVQWPPIYVNSDGLLSMSIIMASMKRFYVAIPLLEECEDDTHTPKMGTWEFFGTPKMLKFDCRGQNTSP